MSSTQYIIDKTAYTQVSAVDNYFNNESNYPVRLIYSVALPAVDDTGYKTLVAGETFISKDSLPNGNTYARLDDKALGDNARVSVMEGV